MSTSFVPGVPAPVGTDMYDGLVSGLDGREFPELADYEVMRDLIAAAPESAPVIGLDGYGKPVSVDFGSDSPHVLINASTGGGKSVIVRSVVAQVLANGGAATILDVKQFSHQWAKGHERVGYAETVSEIGDALVQLGYAVHNRLKVVKDHMDAGGKLEDAPVGPRLVVVFEEVNSTLGQVKAVTKELPSGQGGYNALSAYADILNLGRAVKVHMIAVSQMATFRAMGGSEILENFSTRIVLNYSVQAWRYLMSDCGRFQGSPSPVGRGRVGNKGKATETQFAFLTDKQARVLAEGDDK